MKRMGTRKRLVRGAVGSLCLLTLMVHTAGAQGLVNRAPEVLAPAAASGGAPPPYVCEFGAWLGGGGPQSGGGPQTGTTQDHYTATLVLSNPTNAKHTYSVEVFNPKSPNGAGTTVSLAPLETRVLPSATIKTDQDGILLVQSDADSFLAYGLLTNAGAAVTTINPWACGSASQQ